MKLDGLEFMPHGDTLVAVLMGAVLATLSGFGATLLESRFKRRERERDAALLFGEVLMSLEAIVDAASDARSRGAPYGAFTMRVLRIARRELDIYDRNREGLSDLRDSALRTAIHFLVMRMTVPVDGILEDPGATDEAKDSAFEFLMRTRGEIAPIVRRLEQIAKHEFSALGDAVRNARNSP